MLVVEKVFDNTTAGEKLSTQNVASSQEAARKVRRSLGLQKPSL
jgi:hypothetical protein